MRAYCAVDNCSNLVTRACRQHATGAADPAWRAQSESDADDWISLAHFTRAVERTTSSRSLMKFRFGLNRTRNSAR